MALPNDNPDNNSMSGYMQLMNPEKRGLFVNLDETKTNGKMCPLSFDTSPKTVWIFDPIRQTPLMTITSGPYRLDIFDTKYPKLMGWKMNGNDNQVFRWDYENDFLTISHYLSPGNIGVEYTTIPKLIINVVNVN